ncbi:MAG: RNA-protein complex protein Nop10 [Methanomicrobiales archaeon]|nr:RNA-protein complex protein Nop10 [Methanomicrobiales archaeon]
MRARIRRCRTDGRYTMKEICPYCGHRTVIAHPPPYSPDDRFWRYRRIAMDAVV